MNKKLQILLTGPVAPPAGGISIHIQRLTALLDGDFAIDFIDESNDKKDGIFNMRSGRIASYFKKVAAADLIFIHSGNKLFKKIHILTGRLFAKKLIITLHGYGPKRKQPFRLIDSIIFKLAHKIIVVNGDIPNRVSLPKDKCLVRHAFLPPVMKNEPELPVAISQRINQAREKKQIIICANASRLDLHANEDLYGLDMSIEVTKRLVQRGFPLTFIYTVSSLENCAETFQKNLDLIAAYKLEDNFMLINERLSFVKLIEKADIVIRPTNADGDALTVREAIYLGKDTLASDVVERPVGTTLFKTRDIDDLEQKLTKLVMNKNSTLQKKTAASEDYRSFYVNLINEVALK